MVLDILSGFKQERETGKSQKSSKENAENVETRLFVSAVLTDA